METNTTAEVLYATDQILRWVTPLLAIIASLSVYIYRSKVKDLEKRIENEEKARKEDIKGVMNSLKEIEDERRKANAEIIATFKEGLKEERTFRSDILYRHEEHLENVIEKIEELTSLISKIEQKLDSSIEYQEKICNINHPKN